jgi:uncharacterized protein YoaH (UPF0181 family)
LTQLHETPSGWVDEPAYANGAALGVPFDIMTLSPARLSESMADELRQLMGRGMSLGDALRTVAGNPPCGLLYLCHAARDALGISHREAARLIAREVTFHDDESQGALASSSD